jgi:hypothetical protein
VYPAVTQWVNVKVRIRKTPEEEELDGVRLDSMRPGVVREVSPSIGAWLIVERYAVPEMRRDAQLHEEDFLGHTERDSSANLSGRPRRRRNDWR